MPEIYKSVKAVFALREEMAAKRGSAAKNGWFRIENKAGAPAQVHIYDEIGMWGVTAGDFIGQLNAIAGPVDLHLNTPGGEVFDGIAIYNALRNRQGVTVIVDAIAASIGSVIAMGADPGKLFIEPTARMMIHDGFAMAAGNAADLTAMAEQLDSASDTIASIYAARTGRSADQWRNDMKKESWYTGQQAVDAGLADGLVGATSPHDRSGVVLNRLPGSCPSCQAAAAPAARFCAQCGTKIMAAADPVLAVPLGDDGWVQDPDGSLRFDPDGDGDDDSTPEGDSDHDYFAADGTPLKPVPPRPPVPEPDDDMTNFLVSALRDAAAPHASVTVTHSHPHPAYGGQGGDASHSHEHTHTDDSAHSHSHEPAAYVPPHRRLLASDVDTSPWDASRAWHAGASSQDPAAFYAGICAGKRSGDPSLQSSWALPYRYSPSSAPNAAAVRAGLARIDSTEGLTNKAEAQSTLQGLMKKINPDYEPSDDVAELVHLFRTRL